MLIQALFISRRTTPTAGTVEKIFFPENQTNIK